MAHKKIIAAVLVVALFTSYFSFARVVYAGVEGWKSLSGDELFQKYGLFSGQSIAIDTEVNGRSIVVMYNPSVTSGERLNKKLSDIKRVFAELIQDKNVAKLSNLEVRIVLDSSEISPHIAGLYNPLYKLIYLSPTPTGGKLSVVAHEIAHSFVHSMSRGVDKNSTMIGEIISQMVERRYIPANAIDGLRDNLAVYKSSEIWWKSADARARFMLNLETSIFHGGEGAKAYDVTRAFGKYLESLNPNISPFDLVENYDAGHRVGTVAFRKAVNRTYGTNFKSFMEIMEDYDGWLKSPKAMNRAKFSEIRELKTTLGALRKISSEDQFDETLKLLIRDGYIDEKLAKLIKESKGARKMFELVFNNADEAELYRAIKTAKMAARWRIFFNGLGFAGDVFGLGMAYVNLLSNGERINSTDNPALKELYESADFVYFTEAIESAGGLGVGVAAICGSSLAASGALLMLPVSLAVVGGGASYRELEEVSANWLKTADDWSQLNPGEIMSKLKEVGPGQQGYWQQASRGPRLRVYYEKLASFIENGNQEAYKKWEEEQSKIIGDANAGTRLSLTVALLMKTYSPSSGMSQRQFISDSLRYLLDKNPSLSLVSAVTYFKAQQHAELMALSRRLQESGEDLLVKVEGRVINLANYDQLYSIGKKCGERSESLLSSTLMAYIKLKREKIKQMKNDCNDGSGATLARLQTLNDLAFPIALAQRRISEADLPGWDWTGGEEGSRALVASYLAHYLLEGLKHGVSEKNLMRLLQVPPNVLYKLAKRDRWESSGDLSSNLDIKNLDRGLRQTLGF